MKRHLNKPLYLLASGGTGGHLFPALSLCRKLKDYDRNVYLITDQRSKNFSDLKDFDQVFIRTLRHTLPVLGRLGLYLSVLWQTFYCYWLYRKIKPTLVIGFGGYPSIPPLLAAQLRGIPTVVHEQNALLGRANRLVSKRAYRIATSFQNVEKAPANTVLTGNPVRPEILSLQKEPYHPPVSNSPFHLLIIGGSQGAKIFSEVIPKTLTQLPLELQKRLKVVQQCRSELLSQTKVVYRQSFIDVELKPFIEEMGAQYQQAHLVIARSGASTVAELAIVKRPAILVPYAASREGDQSYNATSIGQARAAWVFKEEGFTVKNLGKLLADLMQNPEKLKLASGAMELFSQPDAAENLAHVAAEVIGDNLCYKEKSVGEPERFC